MDARRIGVPARRRRNHPRVGHKLPSRRRLLHVVAFLRHAAGRRRRGAVAKLVDEIVLLQHVLSWNAHHVPDLHRNRTLSAERSGFGGRRYGTHAAVDYASPQRRFAESGDTIVERFSRWHARLQTPSAPRPNRRRHTDKVALHDEATEAPTNASRRTRSVFAVHRTGLPARSSIEKCRRGTRLRI